ncbi:hypothetical protein M422DRAFT_777023 [Sphaerobolus stellatus SS14]|nr:hypothetical protein M422DRAFT_777023 [Sphaerobolus stellatus SS14]
MATLDGYTRYEHDSETFVRRHQSCNEASVKEQESPLAIATIFYNGVAYQSCCFNGGKCNGQPMIHHGKSHFIGCSAWQKEDGKHSHFFHPIDPKVSEELLQELFATGGKVSVLNPDFQEPCSYSVAPSIGLKQQSCPGIHFKDQQLVVGHIMQQKCDAEIIILFPTDVTVRKAVKRTYEARELYTQAVHEIGVIGATVSKVDRAPSTKRLLKSNVAVSSHAEISLLKPRFKRDIISQEKLKKYPYGNGIEGVSHMFEHGDSKRPPKERYIQAMYSAPCKETGETIHVIVTMLPELAELVHEVQATQHDNTYKRVFGKFNETGVAIARIYCNRETHQAFDMIWYGWFEAIEKVTGRPLLNKIIHGKGKHAIFMFDAAPAQVQGLGDNLICMNNPTVSGIKTFDPAVIVQNLEALKAVCCFEDFERIQNCLFITTLEELEAFTAWCLAHSQEKVRDWMRQKLAYPWLPPALCRHFSKVPHLDWDLGPSDSNLNESSHPATNRATGINLPLPQAIEGAFKCDRQVAHDRAVAKEQSILINHRNNLTQRLAANGNRVANRAKKADKEVEVRTMLSALEAKMAVVAQQQKDVGEEMKALRAQKKQASGGKKRNLKSSGRGQPTPAFKSIPSTSATKENDPFLTSLHHHSITILILLPTRNTHLPYIFLQSSSRRRLPFTYRHVHKDSQHGTPIPTTLLTMDHILFSLAMTCSLHRAVRLHLVIVVLVSKRRMPRTLGA